MTQSIALEDGLYQLGLTTLELGQLLDTLNDRLRGKRLAVVEHDTMDPTPLLKSTYGNFGMENSVHVQTYFLLGRCLTVPAGRQWIPLPLEPLDHSGNLYYSQIELAGDFIHLSQPYYFRGDQSRVDWKMYSLFPLGRLGS